MKESRQLLKREAKERFKGLYWPCVLVQVVMFLLMRVLFGLTEQITNAQVFMPVSVANAFYSLVIFLLTAMFVGALSLETAFFYLRVFRGEKMTMRDFFEGLITSVGRKIGAYLWQALFFFLWGMVVMIPGLLVMGLIAAMNMEHGLNHGALTAMFYVLIGGMGVMMLVKYLSYSMMDYFIRDCPDVSVRKAMRLSITLMKENRGKLFVLGLSLSGWMLLTTVLLFLPNIFGQGWSLPSTVVYGAVNALYVGPYLAITMAGFYHNLKKEGLKKRVIRERELEGA
ncbi:MAG: DUF975 family protein [Clostridia bacterium]|nr:DUF975 family protein [Clostridia bacterium]